MTIMSEHKPRQAGWPEHLLLLHWERYLDLSGSRSTCYPSRGMPGVVRVVRCCAPSLLVAESPVAYGVSFEWIGWMSLSFYLLNAWELLDIRWKSTVITDKFLGKKEIKCSLFKWYLPLAAPWWFCCPQI